MRVKYVFTIAQKKSYFSLSLYSNDRSVSHTEKLIFHISSFSYCDNISKYVTLQRSEKIPFYTMYLTDRNVKCPRDGNSNIVSMDHRDIK